MSRVEAAEQKIDSAQLQQIVNLAGALRRNVGSVIVGKDEAISLLLVALLCEGHVLMDDVPGTGKTTLAKTLARSLSCQFRRIQFTPDLLPGDITGSSVFLPREGTFEIRNGPIFAQIVLADEINRAGPRTQSALLEAMEERQVTIEQETRPLPRPFVVLATQNPVELEGTFPLAEAQLDRFLLRFRLGYPDEAEEHDILNRARLGSPLNELEPVAGPDEIIAAQKAVRYVYVGQAVQDYLVAVSRATRAHDALELGASPRATLALYRAVQARAAINGRAYALPDDVKAMAAPVLAHRLIISARTRLRGRDTTALLSEILEAVPVPVEDGAGPAA